VALGVGGTASSRVRGRRFRPFRPQASGEIIIILRLRHAKVAEFRWERVQLKDSILLQLADNCSVQATIRNPATEPKILTSLKGDVSPSAGTE
jgi:hypothetical protein